MNLRVENFAFYRLRINYEPVMTMCVGVKNQNSRYFDAKLRFALLASLRSPNFSEIKEKLIGNLTR
jgi:hypothetical protein